MKRRLYLVILLAAVAFSGLAQNVGDVFYIYRNDGTVNGFITSEVQSMEYSHEDAYGNSYDEIVTQIVTTADSIYKIPLAQIDSVSFVTPKTEYQPDAINISDNLMRYVVSSDSLTFTLSSSTPASLVPKVGDKLVTVEMNDKFPAGFAGKVVEISGTQVTCEAVNLEEVLKQFYYVASTCGVSDDSNAAPSRAPNRIDGIDFYNDRTFTIRRPVLQGGSELSVEPIKDLVSYKVGNKWTITEKPYCRVIVTLIVNEQQGVYINACVSCESVIEETFSVYGGIEIKKDLWSTKDNIIAAVAPFTKFYWKPGLFIRAQAVSAITAIATQKYVLAGAFDASTKKTNIVKPSLTGRMVSADFDLEGSVDGSIDLGAYVELGLTFLSSDFDKFCVTGEVGKEYVAHRVLWNSDVLTAGKETKVYESFKDSKMKSDIYLRASLDLSAGLITASMPTPIDLKFGRKEWDFVPTFSDLTFKRMGNSYGNAKAKVTGKCAFPLEIGLAILDEDGDKVTSHFPYATYHKDPMDMEFTFPNLSSSEKYKFYPIVKWLKTELLASPYAKIESDKPVTTIAATDVSSRGATLHGQIESFTPDMPGTVFFCWGTDSNPQTSGTRIDVCPASSLSDGSFSKELPYLMWGTKYYYVAGYDNGEKTFYGEVMSFKTNDRIETWGWAATSSEATLDGFYESTDPNARYGMLYGETALLTYASSDRVEAAPSSDGYFSVTLSGLKSNTTYYYRAYLLSNGQISYGDLSQFFTEPSPIDYASVSMYDEFGYTRFGATKAVLYGYADCSTADNIECGFILDTSSENLTYYNRNRIREEGGRYSGIFSARVAGLEDDTIYYCVPYLKIGNDVKYGEVKEYKTNPIGLQRCPDENHPHMIDLGLPSGTKWACCNVGASRPEESGGFFAWGETVTKSEYTWDNYKYRTGESFWDHMDLGYDISGTEYDAAHAWWGEAWRMPNKDDGGELCTWKYSCELAYENGVLGHWVTSFWNDARIFFPSVSLYSAKQEDHENVWYHIYYRLSTDDAPLDESLNYLEFFTNENMGCICSSLIASWHTGFPIRPVCK